VIHVVGRVLDASGAVIPEARVELWQANGEGRYHHPGDSSNVAVDPGFQGFGQMLTAADGGYRFKTILPGLYPGRTRHLHFKVIAPGFRDLATQMYFAGEPDNARDGLLRRVPEDQRVLVITSFAAMPDESDAQIGIFDIALG